MEVKEYIEEFKKERIKKSAELCKDHRIAQVIENKSILNLEDKAFYFIHIIPFEFGNDKLLDLTNINEDIIKLMYPLREHGYDYMYNFEGLKSYFCDITKSRVLSYNQLFRNGIYEIYSSIIFDNNDKKINIYGDHLMEDSAGVIQNGLNVLHKFQVTPPFFIYVSICGIKDGIIFGAPRKFIQNDFKLPPVILDKYISDVKLTIKPLFDILWQTAGIPYYQAK